MPTASEPDDRPISSFEQLVDYFRQGEKDEGERGVGTEHEKFLVRREPVEMLAYDGASGFEAIFDELTGRYGWEPVRERGRVVGLEGEDGSISLEPGGQFELSGVVRETIHETADEYDRHIEQLAEVVGEEAYAVCWGMNPFFAPRDVPLVPKQRYDIMRAYLPARGDLATWMMKTSCTVQANYDYTSEADAADLVRTALLVSPIVSALFANSPIRGGRDSGMQSFRGHAWTRTDADRTGWPAFMYREDWGYRDYVDYVLDIPMFFVRREGRLHPLTDVTFREFLESGHGRHEPLMRDFELHLSTAFPEIRMKRFVEVRGADGGPRRHSLALPAIWKGLLYDADARRKSRELMESMTVDEHRQLFHDVYRTGLEAISPVGRVLDLARDVLDFARDGLDRIADEQGHATESIYLEPLDQIVADGTTLADELREDYATHGGDPTPLLEKWDLFGDPPAEGGD